MNLTYLVETDWAVHWLCGKWRELPNSLKFIYVASGKELLHETRTS